MQDEKKSFRHESLQDAESVQNILKALSKGFAKGKLRFSDEAGKIVMDPEGLLNLKITASKDEGRHRVTVRVSWQVSETSDKSADSLRID